MKPYPKKKGKVKTETRCKIQNPQALNNQSNRYINQPILEEVLVSHRAIFIGPFKTKQHNSLQI